MNETVYERMNAAIAGNDASQVCALVNDIKDAAASVDVEVAIEFLERALIDHPGDVSRVMLERGLISALELSRSHPRYLEIAQRALEYEYAQLDKTIRTSRMMMVGTVANYCFVNQFFGAFRILLRMRKCVLAGTGGIGADPGSVAVGLVCLGAGSFDLARRCFLEYEENLDIVSPRTRVQCPEFLFSAECGIAIASLRLGDNPQGVMRRFRQYWINHISFPTMQGYELEPVELLRELGCLSEAEDYLNWLAPRTPPFWWPLAAMNAGGGGRASAS